MDNAIEYAIFKVKGGYFGLLATENGIGRSCLPLLHREDVKKVLLAEYPNAVNAPGVKKQLQDEITAYFKGIYVNFAGSILDLSQMTPFARSVLAACRKIPFGTTCTYAQLAKKANKPNAIRAAATVMAKNPIPLIIPCHRIIRSDGSIGRFSAQGGTDLKKKLIEMEAVATC